MRQHISKFAWVILAALLGVGGYAFAQAVAVPMVTGVNSETDLIQVIPNGTPRAGNQYGLAAQVSGVAGYQDLGVATTGNTYTYLAGQKMIFMRPSATLAAVTVVTEANPGNGQEECFFSTQTSTALTFTANTGQTVTNMPTAGVANTRYCMLYNSASKAWTRTQ